MIINMQKIKILKIEIMTLNYNVKFLENVKWLLKMCYNVKER